MWKQHDDYMKQLKQLYNKTSKQTQNRLQELFDTFNFTTENIYNIADNKIKKRINTYIEQWKEQKLLTGYFGVLANNIYKRARVKNSEILELLIYSAYIEEQSKLEEQEKQIMYEDANYYYERGQQEVNKKKKSSVIPMALFLALLDQPNYSGFNWRQYIEVTIQYNAQQIYKQVILNIQQQRDLEIDSSEFQIIINRQNNQKLNINGDKISGAVDMQMIGLNNLAKVEGIKSVAEDNSKVRFIAVEDDKTTLMCDSLNNKEFYINKENVFDRYYGENQKELTVQRIRCNGLVLGLNLPPIQHHFHYCRSTIVYNSNYMSKDFRSGNVLGEEQYEALKQYLKSMSYKINSKLYSNNKLSEDDKEYIQNLDNALKGMPIYKGWVKRCVYVRDSEDVSNILSIFDNEQRIGHWNSYISSSLEIYDTSFKMIMRIKSKTGRNLSTLNDEGGGEILFMRNTDFQLIDIKNKNGIIYVKLEEL
nr:MAG TPA: VIP2 [Caudoviricetes sp.]